jgi:hypothetical protein
MTRTTTRTAGRLARAAALPALALAAAAPAQDSVQDYRLPPAAPSPTPTAAGPVDTDHPIAAPTRAAPVAAPAPSPSAVIVLPPATPTPRATAPRAERPAPTPQPTVTANATPSPSPTAAIAPPPIEPAPAPSVAAPEPARPPAESPAPWGWILAGLAVAAVAGVLLWLWRRRAPTALDEDHEEEPATPLAPAAPRAPALNSPPPPVPAAPGQILSVELDPRHLSRALVNATLAYRLTLTNHSDAPLGPLRVAGDIISAHASLSPEDQLAPADDALATIHEVREIAPGDPAVLRGELRLPLASILPINSGGARVFVPLARFRLEAEGMTATHVFVIGQASDRPGGALRPFPLDRGPGVDRGLAQRELEQKALGAAA